MTTPQPPTVSATPQPHATLRLVCAWCLPRPQIEALNRQYPGQISHGLCDACVDRMLAEVR